MAGGCLAQNRGVEVAWHATLASECHARSAVAADVSVGWMPEYARLNSIREEKAGQNLKLQNLNPHSPHHPFVAREAAI